MIILHLEDPIDSLRQAIREHIQDYNRVSGDPLDKGIPENIDTMTLKELVKFAHEEEWAEFNAEECPVCSCWHKPDFFGDCRDDNERFGSEEEMVLAYING